MDQLGVVGVSFMFILLGLVFASIWLIALGVFKRVWHWLQAGSNGEQIKGNSSIWVRLMGWTAIALVLSIFILGMMEAALPKEHEHDHNQVTSSQFSTNYQLGNQLPSNVVPSYPTSGQVQQSPMTGGSWYPY